MINLFWLLKMSFRIENKYSLSTAKLSEFYTFLKDCSAKEIYPTRLIKSIYFDNQNFSSYRESMDSVLPRKKIRIRNYPKTSANYNFEIKISSIEGKFKTQKKNINYINILSKGYHDCDYGLCYPVVEVFYYRKYFSIFNLRVTLDTSIYYNQFRKKKILLYQDTCIMEVKNNNLDNLNFINKKIPFRTTRFSKYCNAIDELYTIGQIYK
jgi:SPX domain protein involved in polyphosphate accumulation